MKKYETIIIDIKNNIKNGFIKKGDRLPTEAEAASKYGVSRITAQNAYNVLRQEGLIDRLPGKGSFYNGSIDSEHSKKNIIGLLIIHTIKELLQIVEGAESILEKTDYSIFIRITNGNREHELSQCKRLIEDGVKGLIVFINSETENIDFFKDLILDNFPIVFVDRAPLNVNCNLVTCKNFQGMYELTRAAIQNNHKKFAFISVAYPSIVNERLQGFLYALKKYNLTIPNERIITMQHPLTEFRSNADEINSAVETLMSHNEKPDIIMCCNDLCALSTMQKLRQLGYSVPDDVSVTGFDNAEYARSSAYSIATVDQNFFGIGETAAKIILDKIIDLNTENTQKFINPTVILRNSLAKK